MSIAWSNSPTAHSHTPRRARNAPRRPASYSADAEASFLVSGMYMDKTIMGCRYGTSHPQFDVTRYVDLYRTGGLLLDELVTKTYPLEHIHEAVHDLESGSLARGVLLL